MVSRKGSKHPHALPANTETPIPLRELAIVERGRPSALDRFVGWSRHIGLSALRRLEGSVKWAIASLGLTGISVLTYLGSAYTLGPIAAGLGILYVATHRGSAQREARLLREGIVDVAIHVWPIENTIVIVHRRAPHVTAKKVTAYLQVQNRSPFKLELRDPSFRFVVATWNIDDVTTTPSKEMLSPYTTDGSVVELTVTAMLPESVTMGAGLVDICLHGGICVDRAEDSASARISVTADADGDLVKAVRVSPNP